jgi:pyruvate kinase
LTQPNDLFCDYPHLLEDLVLGQTLILDSGLLTAKVVELTPTYALLEMLNNHSIGSRRHINLPGVKLKLPGLTEKDISDVQFAIDQKIDFIAASFIRSKANVDEIKDILKKNNAQHIQIISKIENQEALENLDEIVQASDGVMVARGDL